MSWGNVWPWLLSAGSVAVALWLARRLVTARKPKPRSPRTRDPQRDLAAALAKMPPATAALVRAAVRKHKPDLLTVR